MLQANSDAGFNIGRIDADVYSLHRCIYIIDDNIEFKRSLNFVLNTAEISSWPFASAEDFLDNVANLEPAPILIDIRSQNMVGMELIEILLGRQINWPILAMTVHADIPTAVRALKMGAFEFLAKPPDTDLLLTAIQLAWDQLDRMKESEDVKRKSRQLIDTLTPRENEVIRVLISGVSNKIAAFCLSLSVRTIEMHRANALQKLKVKNIAEVVRLAQDAGIHAAPRTEYILPRSHDVVNKYGASACKI